jgi:SAM-dependent methyltransferase
VSSDGKGTQHRGNRGAYERYLAGMDTSMRQKVALTAAHLLCRGRVADLGMGSGAGSHALASLYPEMDVVGVDLDPTMVALAREKYGLSSLSFVVGDIAGPVVPPGSLPGILDSSVLHHVTSFGGYEHERAARALGVQVGELMRHEVLVVRDFVDPGPREVVAPRTLGTNTIAVALLARRGDELLLGLDDDDLPAAQCFHGNRELLVAPAWRLPATVTSTTPARAWAGARLAAEYDVEAGAVWELGGRYHPSAGATPEVVYPLAVEVRREGPKGRPLTWVRLVDEIANRGALLDGHLRIVALRAAHALGVLGR